MKTLIAVATATMALTSISAPAEARRVCDHWRGGRCVSWHQSNYGMERSAWAHRRNMERRAAWTTGYRVPTDYSYYSYDRIPRTYVDRYHLDPNYRYAYRDNRVYVVNPTTYAIERILGGW